MTVRTFQSAILFALGLATLPTFAQAGDPFVVDNFDDGNADGWIQEDFNAGQAWGPGTFDVDDSFTLGTTGSLPPATIDPHGTVATYEASADNPIFNNGYFQGTVRANTDGTTASLLMRANPAAGEDYGFFASTLYGTFGIERFDFSDPDNPQTILGLMDPNLFPFKASEDWIIKGGAIGEQITMKVWRPGETEPEEPQLSFTDSTFDAGVLCLITYADVGQMTEPVMFSGSFDDLLFFGAGDLHSDGLLSAADIDLIKPGSSDLQFDLDGNGAVDVEDRRVWVEVFRDSYFGDSNLDGEFNSGDLVEVFIAGEYEDAIAGNSTWSTGDWNGNSEFDSSDLTLAFQSGGYESGVRTSIATVPEPSVSPWMCIGLIAILRRHQGNLR